jgi:negative regulator of genetic competence, sporulation and motility
MNEQDKFWLEKCKQEPKKYEISVDNDVVSVSEINPFEEDTEEWYAFDGEYYRFSAWGEGFIVEILKFIGIKADRC